jgi:6-phosphogluconolactonase (cycloisomerase 2 family)
LGAAAPAGPLACHVAVDPDGAFLVACCWGDGAVALVELEPDGSLGRPHVGATSIDPHGHDRHSRAHACLMLGNGQLVTSDIGHDALRLWHFSADTGLELTETERLPLGCGPRHFARSSRGVVYVVTEYSAEVAMLQVVPRAPGMVALELQEMLPASMGGARAGDAAAEICIDAGERHLYVGIRGSNRICTLLIGQNGRATPVDETRCGGNWPRNHCLQDGRLVVALERSNAIATFELDADGRPTQPPRLLAAGSPTHVLAHT